MTILNLRATKADPDPNPGPNPLALAPEEVGQLSREFLDQ